MKELRLARQGGSRRRPSRSRTSCARACAWSASPTRPSSCCSAPPATWPIARWSRPSTSCGGRTCCPTSSCCWRSGAARTTTRPSGATSAPRSTSSAASCRSTRTPGGRSPSGSATSISTSPTRPASTAWPAAWTTSTKNDGTRGNRLFYLATQPSQFAEIVGQLGRVGLDHEHHDGGWRRIVIEKPFGHDLESAKRLNREVGKVFRESQVYRIDHYLGKETVRNLLVFRFGNGIFEPLWNRRYVDHVQITVAESIGIENRGAFYEETGASRDVLQNHLLQLVSLVAMEPPATLRGRRPARREGEGPARDLDRAERRRRRRRARPVRSRLGGRHQGPRLPPGAGRRLRRRRPRRSWRRA